jgi:hypothetical protein
MEACCAKCALTPGCQYFTFSRNSNSCWLKDGYRMVLVPFTGAASGAMPGALSDIPGIAGKACNTTLKGATVKGTWDDVSARCIPSKCQAPTLDQMPDGCAEVQCRWVVNVAASDPLVVARTPCSYENTWSKLYQGCLQVVFTGRKKDCPGDASAPLWAEVVDKAYGNNRGWVPIYSVLPAGGRVYHLIYCGDSACGM